MYYIIAEEVDMWTNFMWCSNELQKKTATEYRTELYRVHFWRYFENVTCTFPSYVVLFMKVVSDSNSIEKYQYGEPELLGEEKKNIGQLCSKFFA